MTLETGVKALAEAVAVDVKALEDGKVDKELGKGLSDTNFTQVEKTKLADVAAEATKNRADSLNADKVHTHTTAQVTGLGTAATANLTTSSTDGTVGSVLKVGDFGVGGSNPRLNSFDANDLLPGQRRSWSESFTEADAVSVNLPALGGNPTATRSWHVESMGSESSRAVQYATEVYGTGTVRGRTFVRVRHDTTWHSWQEVIRTGSLLQTTGSSTDFPMSQAATTLALNEKVNTTSLGTAATYDVGEATGQVMQVGAFGVGHTFTAQVFDANDIANQVGNKSGLYPHGSTIGSANVPYTFVYIQQLFYEDGSVTQIAYGFNIEATWIRNRFQGVWSSWAKQLSTNDILQTTGTSTEFPMSQAATTSQLDTKAPLSHTHPWSQVTGQPATATRWPTLAEVTGKPANYPTDWATVSDKPIVQTVGTSTTNLMSQKAVSDLFASMQPQLSITGSCTTNGTTDNTLVLTGIVSALALEVGDVIQITGSTGGLNDKLFTVESITDDNSIIVNYEHAGNRGNGSLKLADQTATVTIERIAKWYNAPLGLGQDWVEVTASRAPDTNYTNTTRRAIFVSVISTTTTAAIGFALLVGGTERSAQLMGRTDITKIIQVGTLTPAGSNYKVGALELFSIPSISIWSELR